ncbi:MAG: L,D-transpeptidase [Mycolicibacterium sp.]|uniref:L,D-transpeptidase n=1 Tax=Mycolicibacterium sp. TaxID=2320850 RepID=UPI003D0DAD2A
MVAIGLAGSVASGSAAVVAPQRVLSIQPLSGEVVGVGHPVVVTFAQPVADRARAEQTINITAPEKPHGKFTWLGNDTVQWSPDVFWPAHSRITVKAGPAMTEFETAAKVVGVADIDAHTFTVSIDDQVVREMPASMGKSKFPTPIGTFTALAKNRNLTFDSRTIGIPLDDPEGYLIEGEHAVRVTWGGVFVHSAPWSVGSQGNSNVSHGCINLSPENAAWYFDTVGVGDPIIVQA